MNRKRLNTLLCALLCFSFASLSGCNEKGNESTSEKLEEKSIIETESQSLEQLPQEEFLINGLDSIPQKEKVQTPSDGIILENTVSSFSNTYKNPLITPNSENAWPGYGVGDPFVMRWNGRYYMCITFGEAAGKN